MEIILGGICDNTRPFFTSANPQRLDDLESIAKSVGPSSLPTFAGTPAQPPACQPVSTAAAPSADQTLQGQSILATVAEQLWPPVVQNKGVADSVTVSSALPTVNSVSGKDEDILEAIRELTTAVHSSLNLSTSYAD